MPSRSGVLALLVVLSLVLPGCSVRLDTPPSEIPVPEGEDAVRQEAAQAVAAILTTAGAAAASSEGAVASVLGLIADDGAAHLDALGGVWEPPPRPDDPEPAPPPDSNDDPAHTLAGLEASAGALATHARSVDAELATLLTSIAANQSVHARDLRVALGWDPLAAPAAPEDPFPTQFGPESVALCRVLDAAGYVAEVRAARSSGDAATQLAARAEQLRAQAELVAVRGGFARTDDDPREAAYALDLDDLEGQAIALARARVPAWLVLLPEAELDDRELIIDQVIRATRVGYGGSDRVPAFPGLAG